MDKTKKNRFCFPHWKDPSKNITDENATLRSVKLQPIIISKNKILDEIS